MPFLTHHAQLLRRWKNDHHITWRIHLYKCRLRYDRLTIKNLSTYCVDAVDLKAQPKRFSFAHLQSVKKNLKTFHKLDLAFWFHGRCDFANDTK